MVFAGATAAGLFWTVNVWWATSCNKQGQRGGREWHFFHGVIPDAEVQQNRMCKKIKQTLNNELKFHIVNIY